MTPQPGQRVMHDAQRDPAQSSLGVEVLGLGAGFHSWTIAVQRLRRIKGIPRNSSVAKGRLWHLVLRRINSNFGFHLEDADTTEWAITGTCVANSRACLRAIVHPAQWQRLTT